MAAIGHGNVHCKTYFVRRKMTKMVANCELKALNAASCVLDRRGLLAQTFAVHAERLRCRRERVLTAGAEPFER